MSDGLAIVVTGLGIWVLAVGLVYIIDTLFSLRKEIDKMRRKEQPVVSLSLNHDRPIDGITYRPGESVTLSYRSTNILTIPFEAALRLAAEINLLQENNNRTE